MSVTISGNYRALSPDEVDTVAAECALAWQHPEIPLRQYELAVRPELERLRKCSPEMGLSTGVAPFDALIRIMRFLPVRGYTLLDVGASSGYYSEVLERGGFSVSYTGLDFSEGFQKLAQSLYPGMRYKVADARKIPFPHDTFDIVLSGACIMHVKDFREAIRETVRVSNRYVIFHRTPVHNQPTRCYVKEAYGVSCIEWLFNEAELFALFHRENLNLIAQTAVSWDPAADGGYKSYCFEKLQVEPYASTKSL